jgi:poly(A) polymerase
MPSDPQLARQFAVDVVQRLREAGHQALWAGGCVRDQLLGLMPKDYDVATDAVPDRVREVFGKRRTLPIGASFGVITVLGPRGAGQIDVATFRRDAAYSDGRHPDAVTFSDAEHDAQRRDFTINGLFYDPLYDQVIDYVGGQEDLKRRIVRAIGEPAARIAEDKLRMLRAVRFAARFDFELDEPTLTAIQEQSHELVIVAAERIAAELRLILTHESRAHGLELLSEAALLEVLLPESEIALAESAAWNRTRAILESLLQPTFSTALAALLREIQLTYPQQDMPRALFERWKLSTEELEGVEKLFHQEPIIRSASRQSWPTLQRILVEPRVEELLSYCDAVAKVIDGNANDIEFCRAKLSLPLAELNPPLLITGEDLKAAGIRPGPDYRTLLEAVRDAQLERRISTRDEALALVAAQKSQRSGG